MKKVAIFTSVIMLMSNFSCRNLQCDQELMKRGSIKEEVVSQTLDQMSKKFSAPEYEAVMKMGVKQLAGQWREKDGSAEEFTTFCLENFASDTAARKALFNKLSVAFESVWGEYNKMSVDLKKPLHLDEGPLTEVDYILGAYDPSSHLTEDLYNNKIAYIAVLNFPFYTLEQKEENADKWNRLDWAYARMGDIFTPKPPAAVVQIVADAEMKAESYISEYNIMMGHLLGKDGKKLFPQDMKLLCHWKI